jgi:hypothetical protein
MVAGPVKFVAICNKVSNTCTRSRKKAGRKKACSVMVMKIQTPAQKKNHSINFPIPKDKPEGQESIRRVDAIALILGPFKPSNPSGLRGKKKMVKYQDPFVWLLLAIECGGQAIGSP